MAACSPAPIGWCRVFDVNSSAYCANSAKRPDLNRPGSSELTVHVSHTACPASPTAAASRMQGQVADGDAHTDHVQPSNLAIVSSTFSIGVTTAIPMLTRSGSCGRRG